MNIDRKRLAPLGLYLAGIAALAAAVLYIIQREWNLYLQIEGEGKLLSKRYVRYGHYGLRPSKWS